MQEHWDAEQIDFNKCLAFKKYNDYFKEPPNLNSQVQLLVVSLTLSYLRSQHIIIEFSK